MYILISHENNKNLIRRVEESRGNRVGNSVFYKDGNSKKTFGNLENYIEESWFGPFLPYVSKDLFCDKKVISNCIDHFEPGSRDVYYAATSGNRKLTSYILASIINDGRRSTFNSLHKEVLEVILTQNGLCFCANQILIQGWKNFVRLQKKTSFKDGFRCF